MSTVLLSASEDKVEREGVQDINICKTKKNDSTEGWNKNRSHLQSGGREIRRYMKQVVLKLFFHMGVLTGIEVKVAFLIQKL